ncbi:TPA: hypothetical protein DEB00_00440 [Candidatus Uhrbacteria bacterium]|nr:hypothetical protein [Candidatus Uhrbacteria bacterium]
MDLLSQFPTTVLTWATSVFGEHPSWDVLLATLLIGAGFMVALWGRGRVIAFVIACYGVVVLVRVSSATDWIKSTLHIPTSIPGSVGVLAGFIGIFFVLVWYGLGDALDEGRGSMAGSVLISMATCGLLTAVLFPQLTPEVINGFSVGTQTLFTSPLGLVAWVIAPILLIGATRD